jgi:hypothetical protein
LRVRFPRVCGSVIRLIRLMKGFVLSSCLLRDLIGVP